MKYRQTQSGVALVITLIMLSVITIIAVAFLALSQRERAAVSTSLTGTEAELAANAGLERAKAEILANIREFVSVPAHSNRQTIGPDLFVSLAEPYIYTNFLSPPLNLSKLLSDSDYHQELTNQFYDPPPPVFSTNRTGALEWVHYLDLNRNGRFEHTGQTNFLNSTGQPVAGQDNYVVGDPQWIGITARPNERHSPSNRFVGRYAFLVAPAGRTLDINFIHNRALNVGSQFVFARNQGHGTWELNLAAFLTDLNTNLWNPTTGRYDYGNRGGWGFFDATNFLHFRYAGQNLRRANEVLPAPLTAWQDDGIDQFADYTDFGVNRPWPGASNPQHFFSIHDWFNVGEISAFRTRLNSASAPIWRNSYNWHTFYRMLAQIGTDSAPEKMQVRRYENPPTRRVRGDFIDSARINLNYNNHGYYDASGTFRPLTADQFTNWTAETFFHVTADKLLREYRFFVDNNTNMPLSVTNLPVYPTNYYTPAVHRLLQMTLNIYDSMTNEGPNYPFYPSVLKPIFHSTGPTTNDVVKIVGYEYLRQPALTPDGITNANNWKDLNKATDRGSLDRATPNQFVYGIPVLLGAKKGFPNFNEYVLQTVVQVERKINIEKRVNRVVTNSIFYMGISNVAAVEAWNSYTNPYPRPLIMVAGMEMSTGLTNDDPAFPGLTSVPNTPVPNTYMALTAVSIPQNTWRGGDYRIPLDGAPPNQAWTNETFLPFSVYEYAGRRFLQDTNEFTIDSGIFPAPQWVLNTTNRFRLFLFDNGQLVDAVGLAPQVASFNITEALHKMTEDPVNNPVPGLPPENYFSTNRRVANIRFPTQGFTNQIERAIRGYPGWGGDDARSRVEAIGFRQFLALVNNPTNLVRTNMWVPYEAHQKLYNHYVWAVNDPLVHHIADDLNFKTNTKPRFTTLSDPSADVTDIKQQIGKLNPEYQPWAEKSDRTTSWNGKNGRLEPEIADVNVEKPDDWDFPTNKLASIGMLGRVHRGSPWQTIYFKATPPTDVAWEKVHQGRRRSNPTNDWRLADVFTVAQHPNASRGRLSVNQTNVAAWSAVLAGVDVSTIDPANGRRTNTNILPVATDPNRTVERLVESINYFRKNSMTGEVFSSLSEILGVPALSDKSLFLTAPNVASPPPLDTTPLLDRDFESIPEKILSLLHRGEPRFVIYAFGQSLKPAPQSILTGGQYRGLVTNYEVSGELASRAVVRVEFDSNRRPYAVVESYNILPPD